MYNQGGRFVVQIHVNKERLSLGSYGSEEEARDIYIRGLEIFNDFGAEGIMAYKSKVEDKFSSQFKCVSFDKYRNKWIGSVFFQGKRIFGKRFSSEILALEAVIEVYTSNNLPLHYSHKKYLDSLKTLT